MVFSLLEKEPGVVHEQTRVLQMPTRLRSRSSKKPKQWAMNSMSFLKTFKAAAEAQNAQLVRVIVPLHPPDRVEGRFTAPDRGPGGWYEQFNDSMGSLAAGAVLSNGPVRILQQSRESLDSALSAQTNTSISMPRRVESIMGEEDRKKYAMAQANQREAGWCVHGRSTSRARL